MEKSRYELLLTVAEEGSFSAAAERLGYTPSGMNRTVSALEAELGVAVFQRGKKGVALTPDGERLLPIIRRLVSCERQLAETTDELKGLKSGSITVGTAYSFASSLLPEIVGRFRADYPGITVNIMQGGHRELDEWLDNGIADLIFTARRGNEQNFYPLLKDSLMVWISKKHPLARQPVFHQEDIGLMPFISIMPGQDTDWEYILSQRSLKPDFRYTTRDSYFAYRMVEAGLGISINSRMMDMNWNGDVAALPLDPPAAIELGIRFPEHRSLAARRFFEYIKESIRE